MKKIRVHVSIGLIGCKRQRIIEVEDDLSEDEIDDIARETMFEIIKWGYEEVEQEKGTTTP